MVDGAFALIDCLGWKGIWRNHSNPADIIAKLKEVRSSSPQIIKEGLGTPWGETAFQTGIAFVSDTVAVHVRLQPQFDSDREAAAGFCIYVAANLINELAFRFLRLNPPLTLRGCIAYGKFESDDNFFLGPGVDEAAEYMGLAEGAFVWLTPTAEKKYSEFESGTDWPSFFDAGVQIDPLAAIEEHHDYVGGVEHGGIKISPSLTDEQKATARRALSEAIKIVGPGGILIADYPIPLKGGSTVKARVLNPFFGRRPIQVEQQLADILRAMSADRLDVVIKRQNTEHFLQYADRYTNDLVTRIEAAIVKIFPAP